MKNVSFRVERPPVPVLWLDTSVLIKRAQLKAGVNLGSKDKARIHKLHNAVCRLVQSARLICPKANQPSEVWRSAEAFADVLSEYSVGVRARHPAVVQAHQETRAMRCFVVGTKTVELPICDIFPKDPVETLRENLQEPFVISVVTTPNDEAIEEVKRCRDEVHQEWEALRCRVRNRGLTYQDQLEIELTGEVSVVLQQAQAYFDKSSRGLEPSISEFWRYMRFVRTIGEWDGLKNSDWDVEGLKEFYRSEHYKAVPSVKISASLIAALLTGNRPIRKGDAKDIEHVSMMLPYADLLVVDRYMKHLIVELGLPTEFGAMVCHMGDAEMLAAFFERAAGTKPVA